MNTQTVRAIRSAVETSMTHLPGTEIRVMWGGKGLNVWPLLEEATESASTIADKLVADLKTRGVEVELIHADVMPKGKWIEIGMIVRNVVLPEPKSDAQKLAEEKADDLAESAKAL